MKKVSSFFILLAGILWGCMGIFVRQLNRMSLVSMEIVFLRAVVTCISLFLFLIFFDRKLLRIRKKDIWCFIGTGICSIVFFNFCYFKAIMTISLSMAAVLLYTAPAIVIVMSYFLFKETLTKRKIIALIMTFSGCILVTGAVTDIGTISVEGILLGLGAGLGYALYSIFSRYAIMKGYHSLTITFYTFLIASIGTIVISDTSKVINVATKNYGTFGFCILFGVVCTVIPYLTYTLGLNYVENSRASIIASIEPVTATLLGVFLFHEKLSVHGIIGMLLVLAALIICNEGKEK